MRRRTVQVENRGIIAIRSTAAVWQWSCMAWQSPVIRYTSEPNINRLVLVVNRPARREEQENQDWKNKIKWRTGSFQHAEYRVVREYV